MYAFLQGTLGLQDSGCMHFCSGPLASRNQDVCIFAGDPGPHAFLLSFPRVCADVCVSGGFARVCERAMIVEYGPVATMAAQEQIHKEKVLDLQWVCEGGQDSGICAGGRPGHPGANS